MNDLPLQVRQRNHVVVDDAERADAGGGEIEQHRRAEAARADHQHARAAERGLSRPAHLAQHDMAGIAFEFFGIQHDVNIARNGTAATECIAGFGCDRRFRRRDWRSCAVRLGSAVDGGCDQHVRVASIVAGLCGGRGVRAGDCAGQGHVRKAPRGSAGASTRPR